MISAADRKWPCGLFVTAMFGDTLPGRQTCTWSCVTELLRQSPLSLRVRIHFFAKRIPDCSLSLNVVIVNGFGPKFILKCQFHTTSAC